MADQQNRDRQATRRVERMRDLDAHPAKEHLFLFDTFVATGGQTLPKHAASFDREMSEVRASVLEPFFAKRARILTSGRLTELGERQELAEAVTMVREQIRTRRARIARLIDGDLATRRAAVVETLNGSQTGVDPVVRELRHQELRAYVAKLEPMDQRLFLLNEISAGRGWDLLNALDSAIGRPYDELVTTTRRDLVDGTDADLQGLAALRAQVEMGLNFADRVVTDVAVNDLVPFAEIPPAS